MRVLVTGAGGFVGRAVASALKSRGHEVVAFVRGRHVLPLADTVYEGDVRDPDRLRAALAGVDGVCHLAGLTSVRDSVKRPAEYWQTNALGTLNVLQGLTQGSQETSPKRIVLASTAAVYDTEAKQPLSEASPLGPSNPYGASKLAADLAAETFSAAGGLGAVSLRAFNVAGASDWVPDADLRRLIPKILAVQAGHHSEVVINGDGSVIRDFVHVADMAEAFAMTLEAVTPGHWRAYNVGSGRQTTVQEVLDTAEAVTGLPVPTRRRPAVEEPPALLADSSRITRELGWQPKNSGLSRILSDAWKAVNSGYSAEE